MLDNVQHIKAFWIATGVEVAQTALWFGVDDLDGTVQEEKIYHMAGSPTPEGLSMSQLSQLVRKAGREPFERDTFYNVKQAVSGVGGIGPSLRGRPPFGSAHPGPPWDRSCRPSRGIIPLGPNSTGR